MKRKREFPIVLYETFDLASVGVDSDIAVQILLSLIPPGGKLVMMVDELCDGLIQEKYDELKQFGVNVFKVQVGIPRVFSRKTKYYDWLFIEISYKERGLYSDVTFFETGLISYSFILEEGVLLERKDLVSMFSSDNRWLKHGKRGLAWLNKIFQDTNCRYFAESDYESLDLGVRCRLEDLEDLNRHIKNVTNVSHKNQI